MKNIMKRPFMILSDFMKVYQFMIDVYERDWRNGVPAPFLEYALSSGWADKTMSHRNMIWEDDGNIIGCSFYEAYLGKTFFSLRPGYENIASENNLVISTCLRIKSRSLQIMQKVGILIINTDLF
ncbi:hypothetical protein [Sedimentibacter sp. B4]|uniref:hypothetical protein n=1 Tax=Sedimentibacter sp. B4 TaxID=304766 RepID=UPI0002D9150B|nr:hypothetical protein [Sedimentibacter sp. B4]